MAKNPDITSNGLRPVDSNHIESTTDVSQKLTAARTRLILDKPFLGALVLRLPLVENNQWCQTSATDARSIYYNHNYLSDLTLTQAQFVLAHEALHCGLSHFARREHREKKRWDVACDHAVNQLLAEDNLEPPPGALFDNKYAGMSAEEIYPCIEAEDNEEPMDQHTMTTTLRMTKIRLIRKCPPLKALRPAMHPTLKIKDQTTRHLR